MYTAKVMAKWDNAPFTKKEIRELKEKPPVVTDESTAYCPCGKFKGTVKELARNEGELRCPVCGNYNILIGLLYFRITDEK